VNSSADAGWAVSQPSGNAYRLLLWIGLLTLFVAELLVLTLPFDPTDNLAEQGFWAGALYIAQRGIRPMFVTAFAAMIFFSCPSSNRNTCASWTSRPRELLRPDGSLLTWYFLAS
jgi:hypothetical protein